MVWLTIDGYGSMSEDVHNRTWCLNEDNDDPNSGHKLNPIQILSELVHQALVSLILVHMLAAATLSGKSEFRVVFSSPTRKPQAQALNLEPKTLNPKP